MFCDFTALRYSRSATAVGYRLQHRFLFHSVAWLHQKSTCMYLSLVVLRVWGRAGSFKIMLSAVCWWLVVMSAKFLGSTVLSEWSTDRPEARFLTVGFCRSAGKHRQGGEGNIKMGLSKEAVKISTVYRKFF